MENEREPHILTAAFTGYRPEKMPFSEEVSDPAYLPPSLALVLSR